MASTGNGSDESLMSFSKEDSVGKKMECEVCRTGFKSVSTSVSYKTLANDLNSEAQFPVKEEEEGTTPPPPKNTNEKKTKHRRATTAPGWPDPEAPSCLTPARPPSEARASKRPVRDQPKPPRHREDGRPSRGFQHCKPLRSKAWQEKRMKRQVLTE